MSEKIKCNECGNEISVSEALERRIKENLEKKYEKKSSRQEMALKAKEEEIKKRENLLKEKEEQSNAALEKRVAMEKKKLEAKAKEEIAAGLEVEKRLLEEERKANKAKLDEALKNELEVRKMAQELTQKTEHMELEIQRKVELAGKVMADAAVKRMQEDYSLKAQEREREMENLKKTIDELKRKSELGSQQLQGEVVEENTEALLKELFPLDEIAEVKKGQKGSDIVHKVKTTGGRLAATVLWEMKQAQAWTDTWVSKAREDMQDARADLVIIASRVLPKGAPNISQIGGVWVCNLSSIQGMAIIVRAMVLSIHQAKAAELGRKDHKESLYSYLTGTQFKLRMEQIVHTYSAMKDDLESEKRALLRRLSSREQQIEKILVSTSEIYGDLQGIVGSATMPKISKLELEDMSLESDEKIKG